MKDLKGRLIFPLDFSHLDEAVFWVERLNPFVGVFKIGLELFVKEGPKAIEVIKKKGASQIFLDLKLFDIPNTVAGAVRSASAYGVDYLTVHILAGRRALEEALKTSQGGVKILGVTLLTSLDKADLLELGFNGELLYKTEDLVYRLTLLANIVGCDGIVCSAKEVGLIKNSFPHLLTVVPGIRLEDRNLDDQVRTATPYEAIKAGADLLVVGRPIRNSPMPEEICLIILQEIEKALEEKNG
uniref:Orotidine 5'-phosphate decarboxylase n=1 Tax=Caldimicrobium thiodismutans TaxID=1653476 RepID=A0A832GRL1_9BACT